MMIIRFSINILMLVSLWASIAQHNTHNVDNVYNEIELKCRWMILEKNDIWNICFFSISSSVSVSASRCCYSSILVQFEDESRCHSALPLPFLEMPQVLVIVAISSCLLDYETLHCRAIWIGNGECLKCHSMFPLDAEHMCVNDCVIWSKAESDAGGECD